MAYIFTDMETFLNTYFFKKKKKGYKPECHVCNFKCIGGRGERVTVVLSNYMVG